MQGMRRRGADEARVGVHLGAGNRLHQIRLQQNGLSLEFEPEQTQAFKYCPVQREPIRIGVVPYRRSECVFPEQIWLGLGCRHQQLDHSDGHGGYRTTIRGVDGLALAAAILVLVFVDAFKRQSQKASSGVAVIKFRRAGSSEGCRASSCARTAAISAVGKLLGECNGDNAGHPPSPRCLWRKPSSRRLRVRSSTCCQQARIARAVASADGCWPCL